MPGIVTEAQREAGRRNGREPQGPMADVGSALSPADALDHGLTGGGVVPVEEDREQIGMSDPFGWVQGIRRG
jgi:hypothetical protein